MEDLIELVEDFIDLVVFVVEFVISTIEDLVYMAGLLGEVIIYLPDYFGWLPQAAITAILSIFSIVVIYKILGREG